MINHVEKFFYIYYIILIYILTFLSYVLLIASINNTYQLVLFLLLIILYIRSPQNIVTINFKETAIAKHKNIENKNIIIKMKKFLFITSILILFYLNLNEIIFWFFLVDIITKFTFDISLLEFFYARKIESKKLIYNVGDEI